MATRLNEGDSVFIAFQDGKSTIDSQGRPRMYKTPEQFKAKYPGRRDGPAKLVEYRPVRYGKIIETFEGVHGLVRKRTVSCCGEDVTEVTMVTELPFCPYCGAQLLGKSKDEEG